MKSIFANRYAFILLMLTVPGLIAPVHAATPAEETTAEDIKRETSELLQALKSYSAEQRDEAVEQARSALDKLDNRIETLENHVREHWNEMDQSARDKASASLQVLRDQRTLVAEWYGGMKRSSSSAWEHVKQGFSSAYESLHEAWKKSEQEFSPDEK